MKKFLSTVAEIKVWICLCFTASILIYTVIDMCFGGEKMRYSLIWQLLGLCAAISGLQYVFFSGHVMKKTSYAMRMGLFGVLILGVCCGFAWVFRWLPLEEAGAWGMFLVIFLAAFVIISAGFEVYFRLMGRRYDALLGRKKEEDKER